MLEVDMDGPKDPEGCVLDPEFYPVQWNNGDSCDIDCILSILFVWLSLYPSWNAWNDIVRFLIISFTFSLSLSQSLSVSLSLSLCLSLWPSLRLYLSLSLSSFHCVTISPIVLFFFLPFRPYSMRLSKDASVDLEKILVSTPSTIIRSLDHYTPLEHDEERLRMIVKEWKRMKGIWDNCSLLLFVVSNLFIH